LHSEEANQGQGFQGYDHPLPSYSVIAADMLRDLVTFTFDLLTLVSGQYHLYLRPGGGLDCQSAAVSVVHLD